MATITVKPKDFKLIVNKVKCHSCEWKRIVPLSLDIFLPLRKVELDKEIRSVYLLGLSEGPAESRFRSDVNVSCRVLYVIMWFKPYMATTMPCGHAAKHVCEILHSYLLLNRFLRLSLNENLLLLTFLSHLFHLVPCIWEWKVTCTALWECLVSLKIFTKVPYHNKDANT